MLISGQVDANQECGGTDCLAELLKAKALQLKEYMLFLIQSFIEMLVSGQVETHPEHGGKDSLAELLKVEVSHLRSELGHVNDRIRLLEFAHGEWRSLLVMMNGIRVTSGSAPVLQYMVFSNALNRIQEFKSKLEGAAERAALSDHRPCVGQHTLQAYQQVAGKQGGHFPDGRPLRAAKALEPQGVQDSFGDRHTPSEHATARATTTPSGSGRSTSYGLGAESSTTKRLAGTARTHDATPGTSSSYGLGAETSTSGRLAGAARTLDESTPRHLTASPTHNTRPRKGLPSSTHKPEVSHKCLFMSAPTNEREVNLTAAESSSKRNYASAGTELAGEADQEKLIGCYEVLQRPDAEEEPDQEDMYSCVRSFTAALMDDRAQATFRQLHGGASTARLAEEDVHDAVGREGVTSLSLADMDDISLPLPPLPPPASRLTASDPGHPKDSLAPDGQPGHPKDTRSYSAHKEKRQGGMSRTAAYSGCWSSGCISYVKSPGSYSVPLSQSGFCYDQNLSVTACCESMLVSEPPSRLEEGVSEQATADAGEWKQRFMALLHEDGHNRAPW
eukprot:gene30641-35656_t